MTELYSIYAHPICQQRYLVNTPAIDRLLETILHWILTGKIGGIIWGDSRSGKSTAIRSVKKSLKTRSGQPIPSYLFNMRTSMRNTDNKFYDGLLRAVKHAFVGKGNSQDKYGQLIEFFLDKALGNDENRVILFVDEAQKLTAFEYELLSDLHNDLADEDILFSIIFIGSSELHNTANDYQAFDADKIIGRFFTESYHFQGITSEKELRLILQEYDRQYLSTLRPFLLVDQDDFTLESLSEIFWRSFQHFSKTYGEKQWRMRYFTSAINMLCVDYLTQYPLESLTSSDLEFIVDKTVFTQNEAA